MIRKILKKFLVFDNMASARHGFTTDEFFETLQEYDIPDEGMNSDLEGFDDKDASKLDAVPCEPGSFLLMNKTKGYNFKPSLLLLLLRRRRKLPKQVELARDPAILVWMVCCGGVRTVTWKCPYFRQPVGPSRVLPEEASAVDYYLLFC